MAVVLAEFSPGKSGQVDACRALLRLRDRCEAAVGSSFYFRPDQDFVRSLEGQVKLLEANYTSASSGTVWWDGSWWRRKPGGVLVATPGKSKHAQGIAADLTFETAAAHAWFRANSASEHWGSEGDAFRPPEGWHKHYYGPTNGTITAGDVGTPIPEDDMALDDKIQSADGSMQPFSLIAKELQVAARRIQQQLDEITSVPWQEGEQPTGVVLRNTLTAVYALADSTARAERPAYLVIQDKQPDHPTYGSTAVFGSLIGEGWRLLSSGMGPRAEFDAMRVTVGQIPGVGDPIDYALSVDAAGWLLVQTRFSKVRPQVTAADAQLIAQAVRDELIAPDQ